MKPIEIEAWAIRITDAIQNKAPHEDSRVECKSEWIDPAKAARRIAAHANAAGGEPILWLIGLDRGRGVVGASDNELSEWWAKVRALFDENAPSLKDVLVPIAGKQIVALLFETERAPFVIKNQSLLEVPWREGTATRSAHRSELIRLLIPVMRLPSIDVKGGTVRLSEVDGPLRYRWDMDFLGYVIPADNQRIVIPFDHVSVRLRVGGRPISLLSLKFRSLTQSRGFGGAGGTLSDKVAMVTLGPSEMIIDGPGSFIMAYEAGLQSDPPEIVGEPSLSAYFRPAGSSRVAIAHAQLIPSLTDQPSCKTWYIGPRQVDLRLRVPWPDDDE